VGPHVAQNLTRRKAARRSMGGRPATPAMPRASGSASASRRASAGSRRASTGRACAGWTGSDGHSPSPPQPTILSACPSYRRRRPVDTAGLRLIGTDRSLTRPSSTTNGAEAFILGKDTTMAILTILPILCRKLTRELEIGHVTCGVWPRIDNI
jgi:hypothetical protein